MSTVSELKATTRARAGKGVARSTRRDGRVPAVIYGDKKTPETITVDYNDLWRLILRGRFLTSVFDLDIDGGKQRLRVLPRAVQLDPVKDIPLHVDFQRIGADGRIKVNVPVRFFNEGLSPGIKKGGVLNVVRHVVEVTCPADAIPEAFEVDLAGVDIARSIHISAVNLPEGVRPVIQNRDFTIATIAGVAKEEAAADAGAAAAAPADAKAGAAKAAPAAAGKAAAPAAGAKAAPAKAPAKK